MNDQHRAVRQVRRSNFQLDTTFVDTHVEVSPSPVWPLFAPDQLGIGERFECAASADAVFSRRLGESNPKRHPGRLSRAYDNFRR